MFVRDNSNNPREISRIFVRDASGTPQEISKIYVRDASGVPKLVFDNTVTTVPSLCSDCDVGYVYYYNTGISTTAGVVASNINVTTKTRLLQIAPTITCSGNLTISTGARPALNPIRTLDKTYWKKTSLSYNYIKTYLENNNIETNEDLASSIYFQTLEQSLLCNSSNCFCNWFDSTFIGPALNQTSSSTQPIFGYAGDVTNAFWTALQDGYAPLINYPILPGFILIDYKTSNFKSTIVSRISRPRYKWTDHGRTVTIVDSDTSPPIETTYVPTGTYDQRYAPGGTCLTGSAQVAATRDSSIYPYYDRFVLLDVDLSTIGNFNSVGGNRSYLDLPCGQEYCVTLFDQEFYKTWAHGTCWNFGNGGTQEFIWAIGNNNENFPATVSCANSGSYGAPWTNMQISLGTLGSTSNFGGDCAVFVDRDLITIEGVGQYYNPYSYLLIADNSATDRTIPVLTAASDLQDCCTNCFYGPVTDDTTTEDMCREIYQIPPINTQNPNGANLKFFEDVSTLIALNTENETQSASAKVRFTLPLYLTLPEFDTLIVKLKNLTDTQLDDFINGGDFNYNGTQPIEELVGVTLSGKDLVLWKALCDILGFNLFTRDPLNTGGIPLSSHSFQYEENRWPVTVSGSCTPSSVPYQRGPLSSGFSGSQQLIGITTATNAAALGQYPILKWNIFGFPTTDTTHYVVFEMIASGNRCISAAINLNTIRNNNRNLRAALKGITLQPVNFACENLKKSKVPISGSSSLEPKTYKFAHPVFIDSLVRSNNLNISIYDNFKSNVTPPGLTIDQGGTESGSWSTLSGTTSNEFKYKFLVFARSTDLTNTAPIAHYSCLMLRPFTTYKVFLDKYYPLEKFTTTDGIPD